MTSKVDALAGGSQPHHALWDATATAFLLVTLIEQRWPARPSLNDLTNIAGIPFDQPPPAPAPSGQPSIFDADGPVPR